ncbi:hypothetical protein BGZ63DRAFT_497146 [Mariannaea sp. PMI_226]|nr:hypothetical protein BGZ63DRAFT_497146 [Mariannaea sp. PMI_226]
MGSVEANNARALTPTADALATASPPSFNSGNESELSDLGSSVPSPSAVGFNEDKTMIGDQNGRKCSPICLPSEQKDEEIADADEPVVSHYSKRKRNPRFTNLRESEIGISTGAHDEHPFGGPKEPPSNSPSSTKGVILGYWRDTSGHDEKTQHAVIGFIDVRERLRTRIRPNNISGEPISSEYPLPPGPGGSWVTFELIVFSRHLVGLDHYQIKEYVRIRSEAENEPIENARLASEKAAVEEAIRRANQNPVNDNNPNPLPIAYGLEIPEHLTSNGRADAKRRRTSGGFAGINLAATNAASQGQDPPPPHPQQQALAPAPPSRAPDDPLSGTRPTRIPLGNRKISSESDPEKRHAVYGTLGQNDMFRMQLVIETRDGRSVDGNFRTKAGATWIRYKEVNFAKHLQSLEQLEIKEYCRVRQYQLDHGETPEDRVANELQAVQEAKIRVKYINELVRSQMGSSYRANAREPPASTGKSPRAGFGGNTPRKSRRIEERNNHSRRQPLPEPEACLQASIVQSGEALERANSLARREIARAEAAQVRADKNAALRERAAAAAANAASSAVATILPVMNGRARLHESEDMQRLNEVWARQESLRAKAGVEDAKIYGGIKYERKMTGPFFGKLVSQGSIINIDGEDYVEYRVLTKPSFF